MFQVQPYPLIEETLQELAQDHDLYIATSKPEVLQKILTISNMMAISKESMGRISRINVGKSGRYPLRVNKDRGQKAQQTIMIGDREHDILGAKKTSYRQSALYGFGSKKNCLMLVRSL